METSTRTDFESQRVEMGTDLESYRWKDGETRKPYPTFTDGNIHRRQLTIFAWRNLCDLIGVDAFVTTVIHLNPDEYDIHTLLDHASATYKDTVDDTRMWMILHYYTKYVEVDVSEYEKEEWFYELKRSCHNAYCAKVQQKVPDDENVDCDHPTSVSEYMSRISAIDTIDRQKVIRSLDIRDSSELIQYLSDDLMETLRLKFRNDYAVRYMDGVGFLPPVCKSDPAYFLDPTFVLNNINRY